MLPQHIRPKTLCYCDTNNSYDCNKELLDSLYPGQTMTPSVYTNNIGFNSATRVITIVSNIDELPPTACATTNFSELVQIVESQACTMIKYTIAFPKEEYEWCELSLKGFQDNIDKVDTYYIKERLTSSRHNLVFIVILMIRQSYVLLTLGYH